MLWQDARQFWGASEGPLPHISHQPFPEAPGRATRLVAGSSLQESCGQRRSAATSTPRGNCSLYVTSS